MFQVKDKEYEDWFETDNQRELRQIFQGQSSMFDVLRDLNRKIDEVVGRQERTLSLLSAVQQAGGMPALPPGTAPLLSDGVKRQEVEALIQNQNVILNAAMEIK